MREALGQRALRRVYAAVAGRYDFQHALTTAWADQRGRRLLVTKAVSEGDAVLDSGTAGGQQAG